MKKLIFILFIFYSTLVLSQTKTDSIISEFKNQIRNTVLTQKNEETGKIKKYKVYGFCPEWIEEITYLSNELSSNELSDLMNDENASLNLAAIIIDLRNNNSKDYALSRLDDLINKPIKFISYGCYDAITFSSLERFILRLFQNNSDLFRPNFELSEKEITELEIKIMIDEASERI